MAARGDFECKDILTGWGIDMEWPKPLPPIDLRTLPKSVLVTYPTSLHHVRTREALLTRSAELFHFVEEGKLQVSIGGRYPLAEAARAHEAIQSRTTTGKLLLLP